MALNLRSIWVLACSQPLSVWLTLGILFLEYVRPQAIYEPLAELPLSRFVILSAVVVLFAEGKVFKARSPANLPLAGYGIVVVASSLVAQDPTWAWANVSLFGQWLLIYLIVLNTIDSKERYFLFLTLFLLASLKMAQHGARSWASAGFQFRDWGATGAPGWFQNSGEFGIQMCVFLPLAVYFILSVRPYVRTWQFVALWAMPVLALVSIVASSSRGAVVGAGCVAIWVAARSKARFKVGLAVAVAAVLVFAIIPSESRERFSSAGDDRTSTHRLDLWTAGLEMASRYPVLGVGYFGFEGFYRRHFRGDPGQTALPHNIFIQAVAELGYLGLLAFALLIATTLSLNGKTRRLAKSLGTVDRAFLTNCALGLDGALIGFLGSGFFVTVLYYPYFWVNLAMAACLHRCAVEAASAATLPRQGRSKPHRVESRGASKVHPGVWSAVARGG